MAIYLVSPAVGKVQNDVPEFVRLVPIAVDC